MTIEIIVIYHNMGEAERRQQGIKNVMMHGLQQCKFQPSLGYDSLSSTWHLQRPGALPDFCALPNFFQWATMSITLPRIHYPLLVTWDLDKLDWWLVMTELDPTMLTHFTSFHIPVLTKLSKKWVKNSCHHHLSMWGCDLIGHMHDFTSSNETFQVHLN